MERTDFEQWKAKEVARLLALVETERRYYQEMVASLPVALVVLSADRSIVSANRAFRQMFGVRTEDLRRKSIEQIIPSPELIETIRDVHTHGTTQRQAQIEVHDRPMRVSIMPIRNWDDESEIETLLMVEEITAPAVAGPVRVPAAALDVPAVLWQADASSYAFTSVSGAAEQMLGYPASHWLQTPQFFRERIHPEDRAATMAFYDAAIEREGDASAEYRAVSASGSVIWCRETIRVIRKGVIAGVLTEISLRKQLEQQLLTAERADALQGLASKLAHDLNNPLMIITGYGEEMLQTLKPEDPMRADVEQILGATERISGITEQLLGFTRKLAREAQPVEISALIRRLGQEIGAAESVRIEIDAEGPIWALADAAQLEEAIVALASGAREDAKERSRLSISCSTETIAEQANATLAAGTYTCIRIRDNGRGTSAKVFENILTRDPAGAAIARAYSTVREWGGDIAFSSAHFRGSEFAVYLPYVEPPPAGVEVAAPEPVTVEPQPEPAPQHRETILLVEDEAGIRALVRKILRRENYLVLEAGSAEEALNVAAGYEGRIDLLLTDVMLPGMGGRELAEGMRESLPELKVLYVSGFTSDEEVRAGAFPPGSKFLQKPFTLSSLVGKVRESLGIASTNT